MTIFLPNYIKNLFFFSSIIFFVSACKNEDPNKLNVKVDRFDKKFQLSDSVELEKLKQNYPYFFPTSYPDEVWMNRKKDSIQIEIFSQVENVFNEGPLDGLVNNAAGNFISRTKDLSPNGFNAIASIVFHGTFYITNAVGKRWLELGHKGSIVSILATWVWTGSPFVVPSAMSKSGINAMTKSLAVEWGPHGIRLNSIAPGPFPTEGAWARLMPKTGDKKSDISEDAERSNVPLGRVGKMDELGNLATFLMADGCEYLTGQTIAIDGAQYITGGGTFSMMSSFKDEDWEAIKSTIKGSNEKDKKQRTV